MVTIKVAFRGSNYEVHINAATTIGELSSALQATVDTALAPETMKLLRPKGAAIALKDSPETLLSHAGIIPGTRLMLVASSAADVAQLRAAKELPAMMSFEAEERREAQRRRRTGRSVQLPTGPYTFGSYQVLEHTPAGTVPSPAPKKSLALLHQLAADASISSIMRNHGWSVGLLSEMPPEGKVGISAMCVLGYNVNKGQEISLRLRTDDWRGFRKYARIRETLIHELAHMVWSEHDNNFKTLNSQLLQECARADVASGTAHTLAGDALASLGVGSSDDEGEEEISHEAMRATAVLSGRTLRQLVADGGAGATAAAAGVLRLSPREAAAEAAVLRQLERQQQQQQQYAGQVSQPAATLVESAADQPTPAAEAAPSTSGRVGSASSSDRDGGDEDMHYDPDTEEAEMKLRRLGTLEGSEELPQAVEELLDRKLSGQLLDEQLLEGQVLGGVQEAVQVPGQLQNAGGQQQQQQHQYNCQQQQEQQLQHGIEPPPAATPPPPSHNTATAAEPGHQTSTSASQLAAAVGTPTGWSDAAPMIAQASTPEEQQDTATAMDVDAARFSSNGAHNARDAATQQHAESTAADSAAKCTKAAAESTAATASPAAVTASAGIGSAPAVEDPAAERLRQAQAALQDLLAAMSPPASDAGAVGAGDAGPVGMSDAMVALGALAGVLSNVSTGEAKYRRVKGSGLRRRLGGGYEAGLKLLQLAGFRAETGAGREEGQQMLVYARDDPGLLWLVSSVVQDRLHPAASEAL